MTDPAVPSGRSGPGRPRLRGAGNSISVRIIALLAVPLISLVALWGFAARVTIDAKLRDASASLLRDEIGTPSRGVLVMMQAERMLTVTYMSTGGRSAGPELAAQRAKTDAAYAGFRDKALAPEARGELDDLPLGRLDQVATVMKQLAETRQQVDGRRLPVGDVIAYYNKAVGDVLSLLGSLIATSDPGVVRETSALIELSWGYEYLLREDALITKARAEGGRMSLDDHLAFTQLAAQSHRAFESGLADLGPAVRGPIDEHMRTAPFLTIRDIESAILVNRTTRLPAKAAQWAPSMRQVMDGWFTATVAGGESLSVRTEKIRDRITIDLAVAGGLGLLAVLASIAFSIAFGRALNRELRGLRDAALRLAEQRLPSVVARLRRGEEVDVRAEAPPLQVGRTAEINQVARAFTQVQRTAIETAVGEAHLRKGVSRVFVNLAWRSQSLLHRQLRMLDDMERRASDPELLEDLYRLDHLTTRMRRHAEGLIILSGAPPGRGWSKPVPLNDVLRGAASEVEDYTRVDVMTATEQTMLVGAVVTDVIQLLAELIENATVFSPPPTEVVVRSEVVANGYAIEVIDRGIGLEADELAEINARLADPPEFDLADSDRLGLFVVGRLAARHGIKVTLQQSAYGGTTAVLLLPADLILDQGQLSARSTGPLEMPALETGADLRQEVNGAGPGNGRPGGPGASGPYAVRTPHPPGTDDGYETGDAQPASAAPIDSAPPAPLVPPVPVVPPVPPAAQPGMITTGPVQRAWFEPADSGTQGRFEADGMPPARAVSPPVPEPRPAPEQPVGGVEPPPDPADGRPRLPRRVRQANLAPQLRAESAGTGSAPGGPPGSGRPGEEPDPEESRNLMASLQSGWERGRDDDEETTTFDELKNWGEPS